MQKKRRKGFLGIWLGLLMLFSSLGTGVLAADGSATITIERPEGFTDSIIGMKASAYLVLDQVNDRETDASKKQYAVTEAFKNFFNSAETAKAFTGAAGPVYLSYAPEGNRLVIATGPADGVIAISNTAPLDATYPEADLVSRLTYNTQTATFYTWIEKYITSTAPTPDKTATAASEQIMLTGLMEGYYALTFPTVPNGISVKQGLLVPTTTTITLKTEALPLTKTVSTNAKDYQAAGTAAMGQVLDYRITTRVPVLTDYGNLKTFVLSDTMTNQQLNGTSFVLQVGNTAYTLGGSDGIAFVNPDTQETIATLSGGLDHDFMVTFEPAVLAAHQEEAVTLTYRAKLTAAAQKVNPNTATLDFTNGTDVNQLTATTQVYTYGMQVQKTFSDGRATDPAVTFQLCKDDSGKSGEIIDLTGSDGVYHVPAPEDTQKNSALKLAGAGTLTITGLDAGTYWLLETEAPSGFTKADPIQITLTGAAGGLLDTGATRAVFNGNGKQLTVEWLDNTADAGAMAKARFEVLNQKGFNLPNTGGAGTWTMIIGGIALIAAAVGLLVASRKRSS